MLSRSGCTSDRTPSGGRRRPPRATSVGAMVEALRPVERSIRTSHGRIELCVTSGRGVPLVLLHGRCGRRTDFRRLMTSSLAVERSLVAIDLPGHGDSSDADEPDHTYTLEGYADAVVEVLEHLGIECAAVLGRSLGSHVGLQMAYSFPGFAGLLVDRERANLEAPPLEDSLATLGFAPARRCSHPPRRGERGTAVFKPFDDRLPPSPRLVARADDRYLRLPAIDLPPEAADLLAAGRAIGRRRPILESVSACSPRGPSGRTLAPCGIRGDSEGLTAKHSSGHHGPSPGSVLRFLRQVDRAASDIPDLGLCLSG